MDRENRLVCTIHALDGGRCLQYSTHDKSFGCQTKAFAMALKALQHTFPSGTPRVGGGATVRL